MQKNMGSSPDADITHYEAWNKSMQIWAHVKNRLRYDNIPYMWMSFDSLEVTLSTKIKKIW